MILQETELDVVLRIDDLLPVEGVEIGRQSLAERNLPFETVHELLMDVVLVFHVESLVKLGVSPDVQTLLPGLGHECPVHGLGKPYAVWSDFRNRPARLLPELHRYQGRHIAAEAVHH